MRKLGAIVLAVGLVLGLSGTASAALTDGLMAYYPLDEPGTPATAVDAWINGYHGTVNGATGGAAGILGTAYDFNGTDNWIDVPGVDVANKSFSGSVWARADSNDRNVFFSQGDTGSAGLAMHFGYNDFDTFLFNFFGDDLWIEEGTVPGADFDDLQWHHWVGTWDAANLVRIVYMDGVEIARKDSGNIMPFTGTGNFVIGTTAYNRPQGAHDGVLDEVGVWDRVLTPEEVSQLWNDGSGLPVLEYSYFYWDEAGNGNWNESPGTSWLDGPPGTGSPVTDPLYPTAEADGYAIIRADTVTVNGDHTAAGLLLSGAAELSIPSGSSLTITDTVTCSTALVFGGGGAFHAGKGGTLGEVVLEGTVNGATFTLGTGGTMIADVVEYGPAVETYTATFAKEGAGTLEVAEGDLTNVTVHVKDGTLALDNINPTLYGSEAARLSGGGLDVKAALAMQAQDDILTEWWFAGTFNDANVGHLVDVDDDPRSLLVQDNPAVARAMNVHTDFGDGDRISERGRLIFNNSMNDPWNPDQVGMMISGTLHVETGSQVEPGDYFFYALNSDNRSTAWIDLNQNGDLNLGAFPNPNEEIVSDTADGVWYVNNLTPVAQLGAIEGDFPVAFGFLEAGGGEFFQVKWWSGSAADLGAIGISDPWGADKDVFINDHMQWVDPSDPAQKGMWKGMVPVATHLEITLTVDAPGSGLHITGMAEDQPATVKELIMENTGELATSMDGPFPTSIVFNKTTIAAGASQIGFNPDIPTVPTGNEGIINNAGGPVTVAVGGSSDLRLNLPPTSAGSLGGVTFKPTSGRLINELATGAMDLATVNLHGGTYAAQGEEVVLPDTLRMEGHQIYGRDGLNLSVLSLDHTPSILSRTPAGWTTLKQPLQFATGQWTPTIPELVRRHDGLEEDIQINFVGEFVAPEDGDYEFAFDLHDDRGWMWVDLDQNGVFERSNSMGDDERLGWGLWDSGWNTSIVSLDEDEVYRVAFGCAEHGGGESFDMYIQTPSMAARTLINPASAVQAGFWRSVAYKGFVDSTPIEATKDSTLEAITAEMGVYTDVTLKDAILATTASKGGGIAINTKISPDTEDYAGVRPLVDTNITVTQPIQGPGDAIPVVFQKWGPADAVLDRAGATGLGSTTFETHEGRMLLKLAAGNPIADRPVVLKAGTLGLEGGLTFNSTVIVDGSTGDALQEAWWQWQSLGLAHDGATLETVTDPYVGVASAGNPIPQGINVDPGLLTKLGLQDADTMLEGPLLYVTNGAMAKSGNAVGGDYFMGLHYGTMTLGAAGSGAPLEAGIISFGVASDDGSAIWVDTDPGPGEDWVYVVDNAGLHGKPDPGVVGQIDLTNGGAGGTYGIAVAWYERAGGDDVEARFAQGAGVAWGAQAVINPGDTAQEGIWGMPPGAFRDSTIELLTPGQTTLAELVLKNGNVQIIGTALGATVNSVSVSAATGGAAGIIAHVPTLLTGTSGIDGNAMGATISLGGSDDITLNRDSTNMAGSTIKVISGRTVAQVPTGNSANAGSDPLENAALAFDGGTFRIQAPGVPVTTETLTESWWNSPSAGVAVGEGNAAVWDLRIDDIDNDPGLLTQLASRDKIRALDRDLLMLDADADSRSDNTTGTDDFYGMWHGTITIGGDSPLPPGPTSFGTNTDDGNTLWIDLDKDGFYEHDNSTEGVDGGGANEMIIDNKGLHGPQVRTAAVDLAEGTYPIATGVWERGGGFRMELRFAPGGGPVPFGSQTLADPSSPYQYQMWGGPDFTLVVLLPSPSDIDWTGETLILAGGGTLDAATQGDAYFGALKMESGLLTTVGPMYGVGGHDGKMFFSTPSIERDDTTVGIIAQVPTYLDSLNGNAHTGVVFDKQGPADVVLTGDGVATDGVTFTATDGRLIGLAASNPFGGGTVQVGGPGEIILSAEDKATPEPDPYVADYTSNAVDVVADGTLTAGSAGIGEADVPVTVNLGTAGVKDFTLTSGTATLKTTDDYLLNIQGTMGGSGRFEVSDPDTVVNINGGGAASGAAVTDGTVALGADLGVGQMEALGGVVDTGGRDVGAGAKNLTISDRLIVIEEGERINFGITGGTFNARSTNVVADRVVHLDSAGSVLTIDSEFTGTPRGLKLHLDASDAATLHTLGDVPLADGVKIKTWDDKSGDGRDVTEGDDNRLPTYVEDAGGDLNNKPALHFRGGTDTDVLRRANDTGITGQHDVTVVTVWANATGTGENFQHTFHMGDDQNLRAYGHSVSRGGNGGEIGNHYWGPSHNCGATTGLAAPNIAICTYDGDGAGAGNGLDRWYVNGTEFNSLTVNLDIAPDQLTIGSRVNPYTEGINGDIAEVFVFDRVLAGPEINNVGGYLAAKYGIAAGWDGNIDPPEYVEAPNTDLLASADAEVTCGATINALLGSLEIQGATTLTLSGPSYTFEGDLTADDGSKIIGDVEVAGGIIDVGGSVGTMTVDGGFAMADATYNVELGSAGADLISQVNLDKGIEIAGASDVLVLTAIEKVSPDCPDYVKMKILEIDPDSAGELEGDFETRPAKGDYLGYGVFMDSYQYQDGVTLLNYELTVFQALEGDTDGNADVHPSDLAKLVQNWAPAGTDKTWPQGNFDDYQDGNIDPSDLSALVQNWAPAGYDLCPEGAPPVGGSAAVPEPGTLVLLIIGLLGLLLWRRRLAAICHPR